MTDQKKTQQENALSAALAKIRKDHGGESIFLMNEGAREVESVSTGSIALDRSLGIGGIPKGRIIEIYGPESSGKTTFCYHVMREVQKEGGICAFIDTEHAMDPAYAASVGVNPGELLVSQPDYGEQALDIAIDLVRSSAVRLIVIDSVAALTPKAEIEGEMGDSSVGVQARMMSKACRVLAGEARRQGTTIIFTNQLREKIGVMFGSPETTPGGRALKFYASVRLDIRRIETLKEGTEAVGNRVRVKVVKNKVAPPFTQAEFTITYGKGFDNVGSLIDMCLDPKLGIGGITKAGAFYTFEADGFKAQGVKAAREHLIENPELLAAIDTRVREVIFADLTPVAEEEDEQLSDDEVAKAVEAEVAQAA